MGDRAEEDSDASILRSVAFLHQHEIETSIRTK